MYQESFFESVKQGFFMRLPSALRWVLLINIVVFFCCRPWPTFSVCRWSTQALITWLGLSPDGLENLYQPWRLVTYMFLHGGGFQYSVQHAVAVVDGQAGWKTRWEPRILFGALSGRRGSAAGLIHVTGLSGFADEPLQLGGLRSRIGMMVVLPSCLPYQQRFLSAVSCRQLQAPDTW